MSFFKKIGKEIDKIGNKIENNTNKLKRAGSKKYKGGGQSLGGSKPGEILSIQLSEPGSIGMKIERSNANRKTAIVSEVFEGTQASVAGLERGDILCLEGTDGEEEMTYDMFLDMAKNPHRPLVFDVRRITTKTTISMPEQKGWRGGGGASAEAYSRKQAMVAAAEAREKVAKKRERGMTKKKATTKEQQTVVDLNSEISNLPQSEEARRAISDAKKSENNWASQLGYNPYETNKSSSGQARNATMTAQHGSVNSGAEAQFIPSIASPRDIVAENTETRPTKSKVPISWEFKQAYEETITGNAQEAVVNSFGIMRKLLVNATTKGQNGNNADSAKFRKVRLTNAKIRQAISEVHGALDIMLSCGFQLVEEGQETYLMFPADFKGAPWLANALNMMQQYGKSCQV